MRDNTVAVIPARAGSKGIPGKNLIPFCGRPLLAWSIEQALNTEGIGSVWVSSDGKEILDVAEQYGAHAIERPIDLATDKASSESAWIHAVDTIESKGVNIKRVVGMQATSPIRESSDLDAALKIFDSKGYDSLFTTAEIEDFFMWRCNAGEPAESINYDYRNRKPRQFLEKKYLENGSFYIFTPDSLRSNNNRLGGRIGMYTMDSFKMFQIDSPEDIKLCEIIMKGYLLS